MGHGPTGGVYLSTEPVSRRLAASAGKPDWHIRFPPLRWAASGKGKEASGGRGIYAGTGKQRAAGRRGPYYNAHASVLSAGKMADCTHGRTMEGVLDLCNGAVSEKTST